MYSEMHPVWQNPIQRTVRTAHLSVLMIVYNCRIQYKQNSSDNLPFYLQTNTTAQMLSIRGEGAKQQHKDGDKYLHIPLRLRDLPAAPCSWGRAPQSACYRRRLPSPGWDPGSEGSSSASISMPASHSCICWLQRCSRGGRVWKRCSHKYFRREATPTKYS